MKKRLLWVLLAVAVNVALLPLTLATPANAVAAASSAFLFHCCKQTVAGDAYCCGNCCMFRFNCLDDDMCGEE